MARAAQHGGSTVVARLTMIDRREHVRFARWTRGQGAPTRVRAVPVAGRGPGPDAGILLRSTLVGPVLQ